jgi:hypothetical protein
MRKILFSGLLIFSLSSVLMLGNSALVKAQSVTSALKQIRVVEIDQVFQEDFFGENTSDLLGEGGVGFPPGAHTLLKLNDPEAGDASLVFVAPPEREKGRITLTQLEIDDPINMAFDTFSRGACIVGLSRLFLLDTRRARLTAIKGGARDELVPQNTTRANLRRLRIANPQGMTLQPSNGTLYILDAEKPSITRLIPRKPGQGFAGALVSVIDLPTDLGGSLRGLAFNPEDSHLYLINPEQNTLYKLTLTGEVVKIFDFPFTGVPQGIIFAPSLDLTDHPGVYHLYLATDHGLQGEVTEWVIPGSLSPRADFPEEL